MKRLLLPAAVVFGALCVSPPADATPTPPVTVSGSYTISSTYDDLAYNASTNLMGGGPQITGNLGTGITNTAYGTTGNFSLSLTPGGAYTAPVNLATFNPYGSCNGASCVGGTFGTETDPISISFTFTAPSGASSTTDTATFKAKYTYPYLSCDPGGDGIGRSDCVDWGSSPIVAHFTDGATMNIALNNAADWAITPTIQFQLVNGPLVATPEPVSMAVLGVGLAGLGYIRRHRRV